MPERASWIRGLDVSQVQGTPDWQKVADAGFRFVMVKTSEGPSYTDPQAIRNLEGARAAGILVGVYHFARMSLGDPIRQVERLWASIGDTMPSLPPALDIETRPDHMDATSVVKWAEAWAIECRRYFGRWPLVYSYPYFLRMLGDALAESGTLSNCPLWIADYSKGEDPPADARFFVTRPWSDWTMVQTSGNDSSRVPGIFGAVDHNILRGDEAAFRALRGLHE